MNVFLIIISYTFLAWDFRSQQGYLVYKIPISEQTEQRNIEKGKEKFYYLKYCDGAKHYKSFAM